MGKTPPKVIIETMLATSMTTAEAAAHFQVSQRWIRALLARYTTGGLEALNPGSRRPHTNPCAIPSPVIDRILALRQTLTERGTDAGAHIIHAHFEADGVDPLPAVATVHRILTRHDLVQPQPHKRPRSSWTRFEADQPNETWQMDYTDWHLHGHRRVYILPILDDHSRYILAVRAFGQATVTNVIDLFTQAGELHGYPQSTLIDNGRAFTTSTHGPGAARNGFEQILAEMVITKKNGKPYHPQTQGKSNASTRHANARCASCRRPSPSRSSISHWPASSTTTTPSAHTGRWDRPHLSSPTDPAPKAAPGLDARERDYRLRADKVGTTGKVTLRWHGDLKRLYVGRRWAGQPIAIVSASTTSWRSSPPSPGNKSAATSSSTGRRISPTN